MIPKIFTKTLYPTLNVFAHSFSITKEHLHRMSLTLCILMDTPIYIDTVSMGMPIVYLMGSNVDFSKLWCIYVLEGCFNGIKQCRPW